MKFSLRPYRPTDKKYLIRFMEELQDFLVALDPEKKMRRMPKYGVMYTHYTLRRVKKDQGIIYLACVGKEVVGCVAGIIHKPQDKDQLMGYVPTRKGEVIELYLAKGYRKQGLGKAMMKKMEKYFKSKKCDRLVVEVFLPNKKAMKFYQSLGCIGRTAYFAKDI